ncbi:MAG: class I SAM-dependent methyltransferase [Patescibacteria group bacterium]|jgi:SAM-dependent methyltransferase
MKAKILPGESSRPELPKYLDPIFQQHAAVYNFCLKYLANKKVLDLGCGSGFGASQFAGKAKEVLAIDTDAKAITNAKNKYILSNLKFSVADISKLDSGVGPFDAVIALQVIEHLKNYQGFVSLVSQLLVKDGLFILSTPNKARSDFNENPYHFKEFFPAELEELLTQYFSRVEIYGLYGNDKVEKYERAREQRIKNIFRLDIFKVRKILPRPVLIFLFNLGAIFLRKKLSPVGSLINNLDFVIKPGAADALDIIAIGYK